MMTFLGRIVGRSKTEVLGSCPRRTSRTKRGVRERGKIEKKGTDARPLPNMHVAVWIFRKATASMGEASCTGRARLHNVKGIKKDSNYIISLPSLLTFPKNQNPKILSPSSKPSVTHLPCKKSTTSSSPLKVTTINIASLWETRNHLLPIFNLQPEFPFSHSQSPMKETSVSSRRTTRGRVFHEFLE